MLTTPLETNRYSRAHVNEAPKQNAEESYMVDVSASGSTNLQDDAGLGKGSTGSKEELESKLKKYIDKLKGHIEHLKCSESRELKDKAKASLERAMKIKIIPSKKQNGQVIDIGVKQMDKAKWDKIMAAYKKAKDDYADAWHGGDVQGTKIAKSEVERLSNVLNKLNDEYKKKTGNHYTDPSLYQKIKG